MKKMSKQDPLIYKQGGYIIRHRVKYHPNFPKFTVSILTGKSEVFIDGADDVPSAKGIIHQHNTNYAPCPKCGAIVRGVRGAISSHCDTSLRRADNGDWYPHRSMPVYPKLKSGASCCKCGAWVKGTPGTARHCKTCGTYILREADGHWIAIPEQQIDPSHAAATAVVITRELIAMGGHVDTIEMIDHVNEAALELAEHESNPKFQWENQLLDWESACSLIARAIKNKEPKYLILIPPTFPNLARRKK